MKIYDSRPERNAMLARCKRDGIDPALLVEVVAPQRHYGLRCYAYPTQTGEYLVRDGVLANRQVPAFILYSMRRDGRISNGWGLPHKASEMIEIGLAPAFDWSPA